MAKYVKAARDKFTEKRAEIEKKYEYIVDYLGPHGFDPELLNERIKELLNVGDYLRESKIFSSTLKHYRQRKENVSSLCLRLGIFKNRI